MKTTLKLYKFIFIFLVFSFFSIMFNVFAYQSSNDIYNIDSYNIDSYNIDIIVNEDNTLNITEHIMPTFIEHKSGFIKKIPKKNKIVRPDGTTYSNSAKITDIYTNKHCTQLSYNDYELINFGTSQDLINGSGYFAIRYKYDLGKDKAKKYDELCLNLVSNEWDANIYNVDFKITMPKKFDASLLSFASGDTGDVNVESIQYNVNGNVITGSYFNTLKPRCSLAVRLQLPDKYFTVQNTKYEKLKQLVLILPILFVLIALGVWYKYGKDKNISKTVEFYPPAGYNSAQIAFMYKGKVEDIDIVTLLIYLANEGYIKICEFKEKDPIMGVGKSFKIIKLKEYNGYNEIEKVFFDGLFNSKQKINLDESIKDEQNEYVENITSDEVSEAGLYCNFYTTFKKVKKIINSKINREKIFTKSSLTKNIYLKLMIIVIFSLITLIPMLIYSTVFNTIIGFVFTGLGALVAVSMCMQKTLFGKVLGLVFGTTFGAIPFCLFVLPTLFMEPIYLLAYIVGAISIAILVILCFVMNKRTEYGNQIFSEIRGLKNFIESSQKDKLEELVYNDPTYFFDMLPYTYALEISDKWFKKFEDISFVAPNWYEGYSTFSISTFANFVNSTMLSAITAMKSVPSSDSYGIYYD